MIEKIKMLLADESGATAIEYALILGTITLAIVGAISTLGTTDGQMYNVIANQVVAAMGG